MARVDSLPEGVKEVLQRGSVIEREFSYELIMRVTGLLENKLLSALSALKDSELIFERGIFPESSYVFRHALTREVVYNSILIKRKRNLHEVVGNTIEELYRDKIDEYYGILAEHYFASENYEKAAEYCNLAGKKAVRAVSFTDAISLGEKWATCLETLPRTEDVEKKIIDAKTKLAFYNIQLQHWGEAKKIIDPVFELALKHNYKKRLTQIYTIIGIHSLLLEEDCSKAVEYLGKAIEIAQETNNIISLIFANHFIGHVFIDTCEYDKGLHYIEKALEIVKMGNVLWGIAMHKACIAVNIYCAQGRIALAYQTSNEALALAEESGDILSKAEAYSSHGVCCLAKGFLKEAEEYLLIGKDLSERANLPGHGFMANMNLGDVYHRKGEYKESQAYYNNAISYEKLDIFGHSLFNLARMSLASAKVMNNEKHIDLKLLNSYVFQNKVKRWDGWFRRYLSEILININYEHLPEAEDWIKQAIETDKRYGHIFELGMDYALYSDLFKQSGDRLKARKILDKAIEIFKECGADGWVDKYEKALAEL
jgi:tetratricopeptide (TPR) repeat protein